MTMTLPTQLDGEARLHRRLPALGDQVVDQALQGCLVEGSDSHGCYLTAGRDDTVLSRCA